MWSLPEKRLQKCIMMADDQKEKPVEEKSIYFHEDDYGQIEILPAENKEFCMSQAGLIEEFAEEHRVGAGFTDMYVRQENPLSLKEKKLAKADLERALQPYLPYYDTVYTGYSSYRELCQSTHAFALNDNIAVFYSVEDNIVDDLWLAMTPMTKEEADVAQKVLEAIGDLGELIIADWSQGVVESLQDREAVTGYLAETFAWFNALLK